MSTIVRSLLCVVLLVSLAWADSSSPKISDPQPVEKPNIQNQAAAPTQPIEQQPSSENENQTLKYIIISLLLISVVSVFLHFSGKLVLYKDYTDAAITIGGVLGMLLILFICRIFLDLSVATSRGVSLLFFFAVFIFVFRMTYVTNYNIVFTILSVLTKYTITFIYTILMLGLVFSGSSKRKGESSLAFELRRSREEAQNKAWMAIITALFLWFVHATTKLKEWSPLGNYFSLSFKKLDLNELATAGNKSLVSEKGN